jgi:hypothetical protein
LISFESPHPDPAASDLSPKHLPRTSESLTGRYSI